MPPRGWKCVLLSINFVLIYKFSHVNIIRVQKWSGGCAFKNVFNSQNVFHSCTILNQVKKITLNPSLHFWFSKPWASFFHLDELDFP
jgi:hypothetical protein